MKLLILPTIFLSLAASTYAQDSRVITVPKAFECQDPLTQDCNYCASNVEEQFRLFKEGKRQFEGVKDKKWYFNWADKLPPVNMATYHLDLRRHLKTHVQGFVRTNHPLYTYAGSHSHRPGHGKGFIFIIDQVAGRKSGNKRLQALHPAIGDHPSGISVIGNKIVYGDETNVRLIDLSDAKVKQDVGFDPPEIEGVGGGGIGMVKLPNGEHLMISGSGGVVGNTKPRYAYFWSVKSENLKSNFEATYLGASEYTQPANWKGDYRSSENISIITECGTNRIFTVHTTGDEKIANSTGYWRLSQVVQEDGKYELKTLDVATMSQSLSTCHLRSTATVWAGPDQTMRFICHARHTIKGPFEGRENMIFQVRVPSKP